MALNTEENTSMANKKLEKILLSDTDSKEKTVRFSKTKRSLLSALSLTLTGVICVSGILAVDKSTATIIAQNQSNSIEGKVKSLLPNDAVNNKTKIVCYSLKESKYIGRNNKLYVAALDNHIKGYVMTYKTNLGYSDPLVMIAGFTEDKKVYKADIFFSQETPGLGDKVDRAHGSYLDQFNNLGLEDTKWDVKKYGGDFDYFTGATVTSRATVLATYNALKELEKIDTVKLNKCRMN